MDISKFSDDELRELEQLIPQELKRRKAQGKVNALNEIKAVAKSFGYSLDELVGKEAKQPKIKERTVKVKYRHPENAELQWTGRGRKPKWVESWVNNGGALDKLAV